MVEEAPNKSKINFNKAQIGAFSGLTIGSILLLLNKIIIILIRIYAITSRSHKNEYNDKSNEFIKNPTRKFFVKFPLQHKIYLSIRRCIRVLER